MEDDERLTVRSVLEARISENHDDSDARLQLSDHFIRKTDWPPAFAQLLEVIRRDPANREAAYARLTHAFTLAAARQPAIVAEWKGKLEALRRG